MSPTTRRSDRVRVSTNRYGNLAPTKSERYGSNTKPSGSIQSESMVKLNHCTNNLAPAVSSEPTIKNEAYSECDPCTSAKQQVLTQELLSDFQPVIVYSESTVKRLKKNQTACLKRNRVRQKGTFSCHLCQYRAPNKGLLVKHIRYHTDERPFICDQCQYDCTNKGQLKRHIIEKHTHSEPRFSCVKCEYKAHRIAHMVQHMRIHTGERPFACTECKFRTTQVAGLNNHMKRHTGARPFECSQCDYKARTKQNLGQHERSHSVVRAYSCKECEMTFKYMTTLGRHLKKVHVKRGPVSQHRM